MTLRTRALVLICPLFLASMQLIGSEVKQVTSTKQLNSRLFTAIKDANIDQIRALLGNGADIEATDNNGYTPLIKAAERGHSEVCQLLIEKGADVNAKGEVGDTPLIRAAINDHTEVCNLLIEKGADINAKDNMHGVTPFIWAAREGHAEVCKLLIEKGADIEAKDNDGDTPLIMAVSRGRTEVCMLLIEKGADINAKNNMYGRTPLIWAAEKGLFEVCQLLMQRMLIQPIILDRVPGACKQKLKEVLLVFNRRGIPKEITRLILCSTPELEADLLYVLYNAHKREKNISQEYMNILKAKLPQMVCQKENLETVKRTLEEAQSEARTDALRAILDPNTLESRIPDILGL